LSQDLADAIQDAQQPTLTAGLVDLRDLDGTAVPILRSDSYTVAAEPVTVDGQITIGPVGVNVAQLLSSLRRMLTRPGETVLTGIVQSDGSAVQVSLQGRRKGETLGPWSASAPTRGEAIRAVAKQYAIQCAHARATSNWLSHRAYCEAVEQLDANAGKDALMHARAALERSLAHDQANLPARLRLGAVLRLLGDNAESADQLDLLLDDVRRKDELPTLARDLVKHHPELEYLARYERNIALAKVEDRQREARAELRQLVKELESRRDDPALRQLYPVALAAWGAAHLGIGQDEMSRQAVLRRLDHIAELLEASGGNGGRREAMAVLENARARVLFRLGRFDDARCAADRALAITPDLTDARITLASIRCAMSSSRLSTAWRDISSWPMPRCAAPHAARATGYSWRSAGSSRRLSSSFTSSPSPARASRWRVAASARQDRRGRGAAFGPRKAQPVYWAGFRHPAALPRARGHRVHTDPSPLRNQPASYPTHRSESLRDPPIRFGFRVQFAGHRSRSSPTGAQPEEQTRERPARDSEKASAPSGANCSPREDS